MLSMCKGEIPLSRSLLRKASSSVLALAEEQSHWRHHDASTLHEKKGGQSSPCSFRYSKRNRGSTHDDDDDIDLLLQTLCHNGHLDRALDLLCDMDTALSTNIYMSLLKACNKCRALGQAKRVLAHLTLHRIPLTGLLGDYLVVTLAKCGAVEDAHQISGRLPHLTVFSWNSMISACVECGRNHEALKMYQCMQEDGIDPNRYTFVSLYKACGNIRDLGQGRKLHADAACREGFTSSIFVGSTLVSMYSKCGAIREAEDVFCAMFERDVVLWNAMLSGYIEEGQGEKALKLYKQMQQQEGMSANQLTFVMALKACCTLPEEPLIAEGRSIKVMSLKIGQALHADARRKDFASSLFVGSSLLSMYGKNGAILEAEGVFGALCQRDVVSWNVMISAYLEQGQGEKALQLYKWMQAEGINPDERTFVFALQACGTLAEEEEALVVEGRSIKIMSLRIGQALHIDVRRRVFTSVVFVTSALVSMYGKCGAVVEAEDVFGASSQHDIVSWTAMLSTYVEQGQAKKALQLYRQMQVEGVSPDEHTLMFSLQACGSLAEKESTLAMLGQSTKLICLEIGQALHAVARKKGFTMDAFVGNTLVSMYGKCGAIVEAEDIFGALSQHDIVSWNVMLSAYVEQNQGERALQLYAQMQEQGVSPDQLTFVMALLACGTLSEKEAAQGRSAKVLSLEIVQALHTDASGKGFAFDVFVGSTLVSMYGRLGAILEAEGVFDALSQCNLMAWNAMLSAYTEQGQGKKALELYQQMQKECGVLDDVTLIRILQTCSEAGGLRMCKQLHCDAVSSGYEQIPSVAATITHAYGSCASMIDAQAFLDELSKPDVVTRNACIAGHAGEGNFVASLHTFENLRQEGLEPDEITFTSVFASCSHTGLIIEALECFESMSREYGVTPNITHYGIILDLLGRAGDFKRVENVLKRMPMQANLTIWLCLLAACRTHGNLHLAKVVFDQAVSLQPNQPSVYVMLSNIYADAGLHKCAAEMENFMCIEEALSELARAGAGSTLLLCRNMQSMDKKNVCITGCMT